MRGQDGFGVKLHAVDGVRTVFYRHGQVGFLFAGDDVQFGRFCEIADQRVIATCLEGGGDVCEKRIVLVVEDSAAASVGGLFSANSYAAIGLADALMTEAYAQNWQLRAELCYEGEAVACVGGGSWPWGDYEAVYGHFSGCFGCDFVVAEDADRCACQFAVAGEIMREGIVVIDQQDMGGFCFWRHSYPARL